MSESGEGIERFVANLVFLISGGNDVSGVMNGLSLELMRLAIRVDNRLEVGRLTVGQLKKVHKIHGQPSLRSNGIRKMFAKFLALE